MKTLATFALALALHLVLGWAWTPVAALAGGAWSQRAGGGALTGALGVGGAWAALVAYNAVAAYEPVALLAHTVGGLLGVPGGATFVLTVLVGAALGASAGLAGGLLTGPPAATEQAETPEPA
jgi:hypothetical protein